MDNKSSKKSSRTRKDSSTETLPLIIPPDGGWGWAVVVASFFSNLIVDGVLYTFGIFYVALIDAFPDASKAQISLVGSLLGGVYLMAGPFVSALANKFGCRPVAIIGATISATFFLISTFSTSIEMMLITYGVIGGIGFGLLYLPSIVMVGLYFDSKRAMATGIAVCGSGIGTFTFAPLATFLLDNYGWRGANLIVAGIILNGIACGAVYRPLKASKTKRSQQLLVVHNDVSSPVAITETEEAKISIKSVDGKKCDSDDVDPAEATAIGSSHEIRPLDRQDVLYSGSVMNLSEFKASPDREAYIRSVTSIPAEEETCCTPIASVLTKMFDYSLLLSPTFIVICAAGVCAFMGFYTPFVYLADYARREGISANQASMLLSVVGLSNTVSRVLAGWLADRPWADSVLIHNVSLIIAGISTCFVPLLKSSGLLFGYAVIFGFSIAAFIALRSIVLCDLLGVQKLTNAFGIVALFQGIAILSGTPVSGAIFDSTGSYQISFIVAGSIMILGGVLCLPVRKIHRWENRRNNTVETSYSIVVKDSQNNAA